MGKGASQAPLRADYARGLTLAELMVVIGVLAVLLSILLPIVGRVREKGRELQCMSNLRQLHVGFMAFAADHNRRLPGSIADELDPDAEHHDWLMSDEHDLTTAPEGGTIYKYIHHPEVYRCPSTEDAVPKPGAKRGPFHGSNGRFDLPPLRSSMGRGSNRFPPPAGCSIPMANMNPC